MSQPARRPVRQINYQASIDLGMLQQVRIMRMMMMIMMMIMNDRPEVSCSVWENQRNLKTSLTVSRE